MREIKYCDESGRCYYIQINGLYGNSIFRDDTDYQYFLSLLKRFLLKYHHSGQLKQNFETMFERIELIVYCLLTNQIHLLVRQFTDNGARELASRLYDEYSDYYRNKYDEVEGPFEKDFELSKISSDSGVLHASRQIHLMPGCWRDHPYSSVKAYLFDDCPDWLSKTKITECYGSSADYLEWIERSRLTG